MIKFLLKGQISQCMSRVKTDAFFCLAWTPWLYIMLLLVLPCTQLYAQDTGYIKGVIKDNTGNTLPFAHVSVHSLNKQVVSDENGFYKIEKIPKGSYIIEVSSLGFAKQSKTVDLEKKNTVSVNFSMKEDTEVLSEVVVSGAYESEVKRIKSKGYSVSSIDTEFLKGQTMSINSLLDRTAGVRVRRSGGMGSDFEFSLDGMSGKSVRFFVNGIPLDYFGSVYSINNIPIALIDRVDLYKGVVPVDLGSDALGGAVNVVLNNEQRNFLDASYSYGSFNTHQATLQGQWSDQKTGLTTRISSFYNYSDNDYAIWGRNVTWADASTGFRPVQFTKDDPAYRFNDDFESKCLKADIGFVNTKWADQFFISTLFTDLDQGVQHGSTMSRVYGEMRYEEDLVMPSVTYAKDSLFLDGLSISLFGGYSRMRGVSIDTTSNTYDWRGLVVSQDLDGGERRNQRSLFSLTQNSVLANTKISYTINEQMGVVLNYVYKDIERTGDDDFAPWYTIPFSQPQYLSTHYLGFSYNTFLFDNRLKSSVFAKHFVYNATVNDVGAAENDYIQEIVTNYHNTGAGLASSFKLNNTFLFKLSLEKAYRLPDPQEALGNGTDIVNSPYLKPEQSANANLGLVLSHIRLGQDKTISAEVNGFFRDTKDYIRLNPAAVAPSDGRYENINDVRSMGMELDVNYSHARWLLINLNGTYLDSRNNLKYDEYGNRNLVHGDRIPNTPFLMSNASVSVKAPNLLQQNSRSTFYCQVGYVHEYFLDWESLGDPSKKNTIPSQWPVDVGASYTFPNKHLSIGVDVSNVFHAQIYDNFLLQKPGRAFSIKARYLLVNNI